MRYDILKYERIRNLRVDSDLSQKEVASELHIASNTLSQYETGTRNIPNDILIKIADLYNTSIDYLLGRSDSPCPPKCKRCTWQNHKDRLCAELKNNGK